ncbi:hypothetical protein EGR_09740 [Echinococcus granulosus]|uniref:EF-hand domain-containing protein n=1 Tax=Echinococcus granulosus TaxID=6210 RepID=W6UPR4_ECHGR|nr:hypothetical protein EGR_09740 [Echinococcus granulosus]EUB55394.1 hypothetical protein EGR_09740 [Echinococcus granulosus]
MEGKQSKSRKAPTLAHNRHKDAAVVKTKYPQQATWLHPSLLFFLRPSVCLRALVHCLAEQRGNIHATVLFVVFVIVDAFKEGEVMAAFLEFFHAIDTDKTGVITIDDLRNYMHRKRYKAEFVTTWTELFDPDRTGFITFENYCEVLGLKPASPKAAEPSVKSESRKQEPSDSTASTQEIKASTTEVVQEVPVQRELVPNEEVEKPSHDDSVERRSATDSVGQENKELENSENEESSKQPEKGSVDLVDATDTTQSGEKSSGSQSRKHKHSKSPSKKDSTQVESTAPTVEAQTAIPAQESGDSNMDIFDWLNANSQHGVTFEDDDMDEEETLVESVHQQSQMAQCQ